MRRLLQHTSGLPDIQMAALGSADGGVTWDGTRSVAVYVTSDGGEGTQDAMRTLVDLELCRTR